MLLLDHPVFMKSNGRSEPDAEADRHSEGLHVVQKIRFLEIRPAYAVYAVAELRAHTLLEIVVRSGDELPRLARAATTDIRIADQPPFIRELVRNAHANKAIDPALVSVALRA